MYNVSVLSVWERGDKCSFRSAADPKCLCSAAEVPALAVTPSSTVGEGPEGEAVEGTFLGRGSPGYQTFNRQFISFCSYDAPRELQKRKNLSGDISNQILV